MIFSGRRCDLMDNGSKIIMLPARKVSLYGTDIVLHRRKYDGKEHFIGYKVVTDKMQSLGIERNKTILTYQKDTWFHLPLSSIEEGNGGWGGIWLMSTPSGAEKLREYMLEKYYRETRVFRALVSDKILFAKKYRIKAEGVCLVEEIMK